MASTAAERIPLSIVTGFLGSGKTTLIAALIRQPAMEGTAVVVNEFGEVGIDDAIIAETLDDRNLLLLTNGCLCCTVGDDLIRTLWTLARREAPPRRIVIETTGLADPAPLLHRLMGDPRLRSSIRLDSVIATADAVNGSENLAEHPVAARQLGVADRRLITKTDLAAPEQVDRLADSLSSLNPGAPVWPVSQGSISADKLFGASLYNEATGQADVDRWLNGAAYREHESHRHGHDGPGHIGSVRSWIVEEPRAIDWSFLSPRLGDVIARHGRSMLRMKGVIRTIGDDRPLAIHGVQQLFHSPVRIRRWPGAPGNVIVVIGEQSAAEAVDLIAAALTEAAASSHADAPVSTPAGLR